MYSFKHLLLPGICICILSCTNSTGSKEQAATEKKESVAKEPAADATDGNNIIQFKVNGETVNTTGHNISRFQMSGKVQLNITSSMHKDGRTVNMNIETAAPGTYTFTGGMKGTYGSYYPNYMKEMANVYNFVSGEVKIISVDTTNNTVNATFAGVVRNGKDETLEIKEGKVINGKLAKGITKF